jgi:poly(3-hydroxybutyrate) depolymerase
MISARCMPSVVAVFALSWAACSSSGGTKTTENGGSPGAGGSSSKAASGGATTSGGQSGSGGVNGTGGRIGSGGTTTTTAGSGGATGSGGSTATGGTLAMGGQPGAGGSSTGGSTPPKGTGGSAGSGVDAGGDGGAAGGHVSAGCGKTSTITSSQYNNGNPIAITVNGSQRRYILQVPTDYDKSKPYKFVLGIHALNSNDKSVYTEKYYGLAPLSNNTTIFAAPNGVQGSGTPCSGNSVGDGGCGWPAGNNNMQLMDAVVKQVTDNFCVDMDHIFATGWSYGASMSYEVGCERPLGGPTATAAWGIRAIAIYAVRQMSGSCKPSIPIGYYLSHGTNDSVLGYDGGVSLTQTYATANGCTWATPPKASGSHICTNLTGCKAGYPVEFCSFVGDHTAYPDNGNESTSWGPAEVWKFLSQF